MQLLFCLSLCHVLFVCGAGVDSTSNLTMLADPGAFKWTVHVTGAGMSHLRLLHSECNHFDAGIVVAVSSQLDEAATLQCWMPLGLLFPDTDSQHSVRVPAAYKGIRAAVGAQVPQQRHMFPSLKGQGRSWCVPVIITLPAGTFSKESVSPKQLCVAILKAECPEPTWCVARCLVWANNRRTDDFPRFCLLVASRTWFLLVSTLAAPAFHIESCTNADCLQYIVQAQTTALALAQAQHNQLGLAC